MPILPLITANRSICLPKRDAVHGQPLEERATHSVACIQDVNGGSEGNGILEGAACEAFGVVAGAFLGGPLGAFLGGVISLGINIDRASDLRGDLWFYEKVPQDDEPPGRAKDILMIDM